MKNTNTPKRTPQTARLKGVFFLLIIFLLIGFSGMLLWQKVFYREEIAKLLPAEQTLAFVEANLDQNSPELQQFFQLTYANPYFNQATFQEVLGLLAPNSADFQKWFAGRAGLALIAQSHQNPAPVLFLKFNDYQKTLDYLSSNNKQQFFTENYLGQEMLTFQQGGNYHALFSGNYLILAEKPEVLQLIAKTAQEQVNSLRNHPDYNQIYSALPQQNLAFIYYDTNKILASLSENPAFLDSRLAVFQKFLPFLKIFSRQAIAIYLDKDATGKTSIQAQQLALFNPSILPTPDFFNVSYFYTGALEKLLPANTIASFGGTNLADQKSKLETVFNNQSTVQNLLFSGSLEQFKQSIFSPVTGNENNSTNQIDLNSDFFPLFQKQYLFSVQSTSIANIPNYDFSLALQDNDAINDQLKLQKLLFSIAQNIAAKTPAKTIDVTLPDGTKGQSIVGTTLAPTVETTSLGGYTVNSIAITDKLKISYAANNNLLLLSTNPATLQSMLDQSKQLDPNTKTQLLPQLDHPTEYYSFEPYGVVDALKLPQLKPYFLPFRQIKIGRKFTQIGVLSTYSLEQ